MSIVNYAIEVVTNKAKSANYAYGFDGTTFRWITGRPSYGLPTTPYATARQAFSPEHYWRLGEASGATGTDEIGSLDLTYSETDMTYGVAPSTYINDEDTAIRFGDASGSAYALTGDGDIAIPDGGNFTCDLWFRYPVLPSVTTILMRVRSATADHFSLGVSSSGTGNILNATIYNNDRSQSIYLPTTTTPTANTWHYVVVVYKSHTLSIYLDGVLLGTSSPNPLLGAALGGLKYIYLHGGTADIDIDEVAISRSDWYSGLTNKYWYGNPLPTWEDGTPNASTWTEGWILQDEIGNPTRSVDISETGDYGTLSGFEFSLRNDKPAVDADPLWKWVRDNKIYFTNRTVNFYIVIDDVFYQIWSGVVSGNPMEEISYKFRCQDSFKKDHKIIPPNVVDRNTYPGSDDESQGKSIPVSIGDITYAKLLTVADKPTLTKVVLSTPMPGENFEAEACAAISYTTTGYDNPHLLLYTKQKVFGTNALAGKYLYVARGSGLADTDSLNKILSSVATDANGYTDVVLESPFEFVTEAEFNSKHIYDPYYIMDKVSYYVDVIADYSQCSINYTVPGLSYVYGLFGTFEQQRSWVKYVNVDFSNGGVGTNQFNLRVANPLGADYKVTIYATSLETEPVGSKQIMFTSEYGFLEHYETIPIKWTNDSAATIYVVFEGWVNGVEGEFKFLDFSVGGTRPSSDTWWFSVINMSSTYIASTLPISRYMTDDGGKVLLYVYNKDKSKMEQVSSQALSFTEDQSGTTGHPGFVMLSGNLQKSGDVKYLVPITPYQWSVELEDNMSFDWFGSKWIVTQQGYIQLRPGLNVKSINNTINGVPGWGGINIADRRQDTYTILGFPDYHDHQNTYSFTVKMAMPPEYIDTDLDAIYCCLDFIAISSVVGGAPNGPHIRCMVLYDIVDVYGNLINTFDETDYYDKAPIAYPMDQIPSSSVINFFTVPKTYYDNGGTQVYPEHELWGATGENAAGDQVTMRSMLKLPAEVLDAIKDGTSSRVVQVRVVITSNGATAKDGERFQLYVALFEAAFIGERSVNPINDEYYARIKGETLPGGIETNNVYGAMQLMMESYDGIPASKIDYTNLPVVRKDWSVGRQLNDSLSSFEYLRELAKHSFVAIAPSRQGKRLLKAWREDTDIVLSITQDNIIRDSITKWEKTPVANLYNDFRLWYNWDAASGNYLDSITLTKTDQYYPVVGGVTGAISGFPSPTGMMDYPSDMEQWRTYVGGISPNSYTDAEIMWRFAHESYDIAAAIQPLPKSLSELPWYTNTYIFNNKKFSGASKSDSPYKYLENLALWCTLQKDDVQFLLPVTTTNVVLELLDFIQITDTIFSNGETRVGWITGLEVQPRKNSIKVTVTLNPDEIREDLVIRERGQLLNFNLYTESGGQTGIILDGQGRL